MELKITMFTLSLNPAEFRALSRALRESNDPDAKELQEKLLRERARQFKALMDAYDKDEHNLDKKADSK